MVGTRDLIKYIECLTAIVTESTTKWKVAFAHWRMERVGETLEVNRREARCFS